MPWKKIGVNFSCIEHFGAFKEKAESSKKIAYILAYARRIGIHTTSPDLYKWRNSAWQRNVPTIDWWGCWKSIDNSTQCCFSSTICRLCTHGAGYVEMQSQENAKSKLWSILWVTNAWSDCGTSTVHWNVRRAIVKQRWRLLRRIVASSGAYLTEWTRR